MHTAVVRAGLDNEESLVVVKSSMLSQAEVKLPEWDFWLLSGLPRRRLGQEMWHEPEAVATLRPASVAPHAVRAKEKTFTFYSIILLLKTADPPPH